MFGVERELDSGLYLRRIWFNIIITAAENITVWWMFITYIEYRVAYPTPGSVFYNHKIVWHNTKYAWSFPTQFLKYEKPRSNPLSDKLAV